jgi:2,3-bisphosphoglycerate-dependent phosphoglycerate mutase
MVRFDIDADFLEAAVAERQPVLILLRHGESIWNRDNLFTGWVDVPLSPKGIDEAFAAGKALATYDIDIVYCSSLVRAVMTAMIALCQHPSGKTPVIQYSGGRMEAWGKVYSDSTKEKVLPVYMDEALNERMYGALQGLNKKETAEKFGAEQVHQWRRSFRTAPPEGESLEMTLQRTLPYFKSTIEPSLKAGKTVLVSAHGNSLRAIIKHIEQMDEETILRYELATGLPIAYTWKRNTYTKIS